MNAQYIYHDVNPNVYLINTQYNIDLNQDGINDFRLSTSTTWAPTYNGFHSIYTYDTNQVVCDANGPRVLNTNDTISANSQWGTNGQLLLEMNMQYVSGNWNSVGIRYVGLRFAINNSWHYGWIRIEVNNNIILYDWGYNATPDSSIIAGNGIDVGIAPNYLGFSSVYAYGKQVKVNTEQQSTPTVFRLFNSTGQLVNQQELEAAETFINCEKLPAGIYFAEVSCDGKVFSQKLLLNDL
jgi:hypothetical protein